MFNYIKSKTKIICYDIIAKIFNAIIQLDLSDTSHILDFCNKYGVLRYDYMHYLTSAQLQFISFQDEYVTLFDELKKYETLDHFIREARDIKNIFKPYIAIKNKNKSEVKNICKSLSCMDTIPFLSEEYIVENNKNILKQQNRNFYYDFPKSTDEFFKYARRILLSSLTFHSMYCFNTIEISKTNNLITHTRFTCLLDALYLYFYTLISDDIEIKKCCECGNYFIVYDKRGNRNFCPRPDEEKGNRSACENRFNQKRHNHKLKAMKSFNYGKSFNYVYETLNNNKYAPLDIVIKWYNEYKEKNQGL